MHGCQQFEFKYGTPSSFTGGKSGNLKHLAGLLVILRDVGNMVQHTGHSAPMMSFVEPFIFQEIPFITIVISEVFDCLMKT